MDRDPPPSLWSPLSWDPLGEIESVPRQAPAPHQISHLFLFNLSHKRDIQRLVLMLAGNLCLWDAFLVMCVYVWWLLHCVVLYSSSPSLPNALSSLAHQSMARESAVLHQASHYSLCLLPMPSLLTTWVCDHVWSYCASPQKALIKFRFFLASQHLKWHTALLIYTCF